MEPVQKSRRERWTAEAVKALQKAVETHLRGDNDVNWAGVARELGTTADRVKKKWRKLQKNDNTGAVSGLDVLSATGLPTFRPQAFEQPIRCQNPSEFDL